MGYLGAHARARLARPAIVVGLALAGIAGTDPAGVAATGGSLDVVGHDALGSRGMNAALAMADHCAYVGSRNDAAPLVVDVSNPATPSVVGKLAAHAGSTPRELRTVPESRELVVMFYAVGGGINGLDLYRWSADCASPALAGHYDFGSRAPHEFYLWQDPRQPLRVLLYVGMFGAGGDSLDVVDISDPAHPGRLGGWAAPGSYGHAPLHSISLSADGNTAYVSLWTGGLMVADVSDFAAGRGAPNLRPLTAPAGVYKTPPGDVHSAVPLPGTSLLLTTDERYPAPYGQGCPFGIGHIVDVSSPGQPRAIGTLAVPENDATTCRGAPSGTWTSHNPTLTAHLALVSWYSAGLQVFGLDNPANPQRLAEVRPSGVSPGQRDLQLGTSEAMTWSYPIVVGGLVYVVDINQGLWVLRYHGPHEQEISSLAFAEGNSNLTSALTSGPSAVPTVGATPTPSPTPTTTAAGPSAKPASLALPIAAGVGAAIIAAAVAAVLVLRRRRQGPATP